MKIDQPSAKPVPASAVVQAVPAKGGPSASATTNANTTAGAHANANAAAASNKQTAGVAVTVSTLARTLGASQRGDAADVDAKKVDAVRSAIQQGTYQVNAEAIADKLLANAEEMLNRSRR